MSASPPELCAPGVVLRFAFGPLCWSLERAKATHFVHDSLVLHLILESFEGAVDWFAFANDDFRHVADWLMLRTGLRHPCCADKPVPRPGDDSSIEGTCPRETLRRGPQIHLLRYDGQTRPEILVPVLVAMTGSSANRAARN